LLLHVALQRVDLTNSLGSALPFSRIPLDSLGCCDQNHPEIGISDTTTGIEVEMKRQKEKPHQY
jgi:hypothetical protein